MSEIPINRDFRTRPDAMIVSGRSVTGWTTTWHRAVRVTNGP